MTWTAYGYTTPTYRDPHPAGAVAHNGMSLDCANGQHRLCLAGWCACTHRDCPHRR